MKLSTTPQGEARLNNKALEFFKVMHELYKDTLDFSKSIYTGYSKPITFICPQHEEVTMTPEALRKGHGCKLCSKEARVKNSYDTVENFILKAKEIHGDKYDYSLVQYVNSRTKVNIICPVHGKFSQLPYGHLKSETGCDKCGSEKSHITQTYSQEDILLKFKKYHKNNFNYSKVNYVSMHTTVIVICNRCKEEIEVTPNNHIRRDCPNCCKVGGFNQTKPGILYYLSVFEGRAYKIGITNNSVEKRFGADIKNIKVVKTWYYENGREAYNRELSILREYKEYAYTGVNLLENGNTELFNRDILNLDIAMQ